MLFPRFRTKDRDIDTDVARVLPIRDAVATALREGESELAGLTKRLDESTASAAFLFGTESTSEADRDAVHATRLNELEGFIVRGQMRQRYLQRQITALREILKQLEGIATPRTEISQAG